MAVDEIVELDGVRGLKSRSRSCPLSVENSTLPRFPDGGHYQLDSEPQDASYRIIDIAH
jgi:hypothetical protein